jgi:putative ABC transport system permease protein
MKRLVKSEVLMSDLWDNVRHALRMFRSSPGFSLAAVAALALGIGINTAIFTVVDAVLLKPLTYPDPDHIVQFLITSTQGEVISSGMSIPDFVLFEKQTSVFQDVAAYDWGGPGFNLTGDRPEQVRGIHVTQGYFRLFGAPVILGRTFTAKEDSPNGGKVAVLSYGLWQRKFGGNPNIIGTALSLGNEPYTVVGVLGKSFVSDAEADILLPFQFDPNSTNQGHYFTAVARLKPDFTLGQANALLKVATNQFRRRYPRWIRPAEEFTVKPLLDMVVGDARKSLLLMLGSVSLVLLIACANVANLLLIRATGRKREFAIRAALGASQSRIVFQLLLESVLLSFAGGILGVLLGYIGMRGLLAMSPGDIPRIGEHGGTVSIDWRVLAFTLGVSLFTGILFGLFPALGASRPDLNSTLKDSSNRSGTGFQQSKARSLLVISEISLALVLLVGAALLIRTFQALQKVNAGFDSRNVLTFEMSLTGDRFQKTAAVAQLVRDGLQRLDAIPGIETSTSVSCLPMDSNVGLNFNIVGKPVDEPLRNVVGWISASTGYLNLFKIPILRGRNFTDGDVAGAPGVVLINESMAKKYWPKEEPVGQQIIIGQGVGPEYEEPPRQIIGIVGDTHNNGLGQEPLPLMIVPQAQVTDGMTALTARMRPITWVVRTHTEPHQLIPAISEQLRQASGGFPVAHVRSMDEVLVGTTARESFNMLLLSIFGASALVLASIGIYGLMAYSVQQRTQEMGIRMALGADRGRIRNLVVWQGMQLTIAGVFLGLGAAFGLTHLIASFLFGVKPWDPVVFVTVPIVLELVALLAVWLPATRASRLDPIEALRVE